MDTAKDPEPAEAPGTRLVQAVSHTLIRELLTADGTRGHFQREILQRLVIESMTVAVEAPTATFSLRVRDRRDTSRCGVAALTISWALDDAVRPGFADDLASNFLCELDEDVSSEWHGNDRANVLRWDS